MRGVPGHGSALVIPYYTSAAAPLSGGSSMQQSLIPELAGVHHLVCGLDPSQLQDTVRRLDPLLFRLRVAIRDGLLDDGARAVITMYINDIRVLAQAATESRSIRKEAQQHIMADITEVIEKELSGLLDPTSSAVTIDELDYTPWKSWFMDHIAYPYPSDTEVKALIPLVPNMTRAQFRTWFTNNRRRTGWVDLFKKHAGNSRFRMQEIFATYDDPVACLSMDEATRKATAKVKNYFAEIQKFKAVDPELEKIIARHNITPVKRSKALAAGSAGPADGASPSSSPTDITSPDYSIADSVSLRSSSGGSLNAITSDLTFTSPVTSTSGAIRTPSRKRTKELVASSPTEGSPTARKQARKPSLYQKPNKPATRKAAGLPATNVQADTNYAGVAAGSSTSWQPVDPFNNLSGDISVPTLDARGFNADFQLWNSDLFAPLDFFSTNTSNSTSLSDLVHSENAATPYMSAAVPWYGDSNNSLEQ